MNTKKFEVICLNGYVNINTLSPNGNIYYQITKPIEMSMGNWGCKIRFLNNQNEIIYFSGDRYAHSLYSKKFDAVKWLKSGALAIFFEYKRNEIYHFVLLDFENLVIKRLPTEINNVPIRDIITRESYDDSKVTEYFAFDDIVIEKLLIQEQRKEPFIKSLFKGKWMP